VLLRHDHTYTISAAIDQQGRLLPVSGIGLKALASQHTSFGAPLVALVISHWQVKEHTSNAPQDIELPSIEDQVNHADIKNPNIYPYLISAQTLEEAEDELTQFLDKQLWLKRIRSFDYEEFFLQRGFNQGIVGRSWLRDLIDNKLDELSHGKEGGYLLLTADAGYGKSHFLAHLANEFSPAAIHFIQRTGNWNKPTEFFASMAAQIALRFGLTQDDLPKLANDWNLDTASSAHLLHQALKQASKKLNGKRLIILLDGLDEAFGPDGEYQHEFKTSLWPNPLPEGVIWLISSRPQDVSRLPSSGIIQIKMEDHDKTEFVEANKSDLRLFIDQRLKEIGFHAQTSDNYQRLIDALLQASDGLFIVADMLLHADGGINHDAEKDYLIKRVKTWKDDPSIIPKGLNAWIELQWTRIQETGLINATELTLGLCLLQTANIYLDDNQLDVIEELTDRLPSIKAKGVCLKQFVSQSTEHGISQWRLLLKVAGNLFISQPPNLPRYYKLRHASFEEAAIERMNAIDNNGEIERKLHLFWTQCCAQWSSLRLKQPFCDYALTYLPRHAIAANEAELAQEALEDVALDGYLYTRLQQQEKPGETEPKVIHELILDYRRLIGKRPHLAGQPGKLTSIDDLHRVFNQNGHYLGEGEPLVQLLYNSLAAEWSEDTPFGQEFREAAYSYPGPWIEELNPEPLDRTLIRILTGHTERINHLEYWPKNPEQLKAAQAEGPVTELIITGSDDGTARVYEAITGRCQNILKGHSEKITHLDITPDGKTIVTACDYTISLWDTTSGTQIHQSQNSLGKNETTTLAFGLNGKILVHGCGNYTTHLWKTSNGNDIEYLKGHNDFFEFAACSPDSKKFAFITNSNGSYLVDMATKKKIEISRGDLIVFNQNGKLLAVGYHNIRFIDTSSGKVFKVLKCHPHDPTCFAFSPDPCSKWFASGSEDRTITLWNTNNWKSRKLKKQSVDIRMLAFTPDSNKLVTVNTDETARIWNTINGEELGVFQGHTESIENIKFSHDSRVLIINSNGIIRLFDTKFAWDTHSNNSCYGNISTLVFSPNGKMLATGSWDNTVYLWDTTTGEIIRPLHGHSRPILYLSFSSNNKLIAASSYDGTIRIWDSASGNIVKVIESNTNLISTMTFSQDSSMFAAGYLNDKVYIWDTTSWKTTKTLDYPQKLAVALSFSTDNKVLAVYNKNYRFEDFKLGGKKNNVMLWDTTNWDNTKTMEMNWFSSAVTAFCLNNKLLANTYTDRREITWYDVRKYYYVNLWNVGTKKKYHTLKLENTSPPETIMISPDNKILAILTYNNTVQFWDVVTKKTISVRMHPLSTCEEDTYRHDGLGLVGTFLDNKYIGFIDFTADDNYKIIESELGWCDSYAFSPNSKIFAVLSTHKISLTSPQHSGCAVKRFPNKLGCFTFHGLQKPFDLICATIEKANNRPKFHHLRLHNMADQ
jgi:WD40 repeat protein